jgi:molybdate transport system substrate-binding protein
VKKLGIIALALCLPVLAAGCGANAKASAKDKTLIVLAAASLTGTFTQLAGQFEGEHPGVHVKLVFDSSATLAQQAIQHAPGDVLATADRKTMDQAASAGGLAGGTPTQFATNVIELAVPADNPAGIHTLGDLDQRGVTFLTCVPTAPCGSAAAALLEQDGVTRSPASEEVDVKSVITKVAAGEADAGLVYRTDVVAAGSKVNGIEVPGAADSPNTYWLAVTADASDRSLAAAWVTFVTSTKGQAVLRAAGFGTGG